MGKCRFETCCYAISRFAPDRIYGYSISFPDMGKESDAASTLTRRTALTTIAVGSFGVLAGCLDGEDDGPRPVALDDGQVCDNCDMRIEMHAGPAGQSFYLDDTPADLSDDRDDGVAWFCSTRCTYAFTLEQEELDYEPVVSYATDYTDLEYELSEDDGATEISAHLEADAFTELDELTFVVDSDVEGAMGSSLIGFSAADDAEVFADEHGGDLFEHDEVTLDVISALGM